MGQLPHMDSYIQRVNDAEEIWQIIHNKIPTLKSFIQKKLK